MEERVETNGVESEEEERGKLRPADIDADMREMERRKRVEALMTSRLFREELEKIVEAHVRDGGAPVGGLLQQIQDMMNTQSRSNNYGFKGSSCVIPINDIRGVESMSYAKGEKILRCKLAAVYRLMDLYGWTTGINNHITGRLNDSEEVLLVNAFGMLYHEVTASSLVKVDMQGNIIEPGTTNYGVNTTSFQLHAAIHSARPDLKCVIHVHTPSVLAVSSLKIGLLPLSEESAVIGEISTHTPTGSLQEPEEKDKLIRNLGPINKVLLLSNNGAVCCGETVEEAFFNVYNTVLACESQMKVVPLGLENLVLLPDETRKALYDQAHKVPDLTALPSSGGHMAENKEKRWRIGGLHFEALMRMLDNAGFRTGYIYRTPLVKGEPPKPRNDVEVPPAVSSLGYLLEEEEMYRNWKKMGATKSDRTRWLNSPNVYQKVEILETGTPDPKKITKWVAEGSPTHSSTPVKITSALQFVPSNTNPKEFKKLQQQIKENRRADKITSGPQSHILEGVSWEEAKKLQDANASTGGDQIVLVGAASKGIIQREYQHNATVYKTPYAKNPFDQVSQQELDDYKRNIQRKQRGESYDEDASESEALSSSAALPPSGFKSPLSETEDDSRTEPRVLRIETKTAPLPSQAEYVLSDDWWRIARNTEERMRCMAKITDLPSPIRRAMKVLVENKKIREEIKREPSVPLRSPALVSRATQTIMHISNVKEDTLCTVEPFQQQSRSHGAPSMKSVIQELNEVFSHRRLSSSDEYTCSIPEKDDAGTEKGLVNGIDIVPIDQRTTEKSLQLKDPSSYGSPAFSPIIVSELSNQFLSFKSVGSSNFANVEDHQSNCTQSVSNDTCPTTYISKTPEEKRAFKEVLNSSLRVNETRKNASPYLNKTTLLFNDSDLTDDIFSTCHSSSYEETKENLCSSGCCDENGKTPSKLEKLIPNFHDFYEKCDPGEIFQADDDELSVRVFYDSFSAIDENDVMVASFEDNKPSYDVIAVDNHPILVDENIIHGKKYLLGRFLNEPDPFIDSDSNNNILNKKDENLYKDRDSSLGTSIESIDQTETNRKLLSVDSGLESQERVNDGLYVKQLLSDAETENELDIAFEESAEGPKSDKSFTESINEFLMLESICEKELLLHDRLVDSKNTAKSRCSSLPSPVPPKAGMRQWKSLPCLKVEEDMSIKTSAAFISLSTLHSYYTLVTCVDQATSMDDMNFELSDTSSHKSSLSDFDNTYLITKSLEEEMVPLLGLPFGSNDNILGTEELAHDNDVIAEKMSAEEPSLCGRDNSIFGTDLSCDKAIPVPFRIEDYQSEEFIETPKSSRNRYGCEDDYRNFNNSLRQSSSLFPELNEQLQTVYQGDQTTNSDLLSFHSVLNPTDNSFFSTAETENHSFGSVCDTNYSDVECDLSASLESEHVFSEMTVEHEIGASVTNGCGISVSSTIRCGRNADVLLNESSDHSLPSQSSLNELYTIFETSSELSPEY